MKTRNNLSLLIKAIFIAAILSYITFEIYDGYLKSFSLYHIDFNKQRRKMGIPLIDPLWKDTDKRDNYWVDNNFNHHSKQLIIKDGNINLEVDRFFLADSSNLLVYSRYDRSKEHLISQRCEIMLSLSEERVCSCKMYKHLWK